MRCTFFCPVSAPFVNVLLCVFFQNSVATFTAVEMFTFTDLVAQAVLLGVYALDRTSIKKRVLDSPDVLTAIRDVPHLQEYVSSLYDCNYHLFFESLGTCTGWGGVG